MQSSLRSQACPVLQALLFTAQNFSPCNLSCPTPGAERKASGQFWKHTWWGGSSRYKKGRSKSVSLADARCCNIMTITQTFLYLNGVFFSINSFKRAIVKYNNLSHIWIWTEHKLSWLSTFESFQSHKGVIEVGSDCILVLSRQYWYDLLAILKCNAALNHGCTVPISPLSPGCCRICLQCVTELTVNASQHFGTDPGLSWEEAVLKWTCQSLAELEKRIQARFETRFVHTCTSWPCFSRGLQFWA